MELNIEQIIKALECCMTTSQSDCSDCGYRGTTRSTFLTCTNCLISDALSLIKELTVENKLLNVELGNASSEILRLIDREKELTEENERLRAEVSVKKKLLDEAERRYDETAKRFYKEGVKDIQSEIKKSLSALCKGDVTDICRMIDQIAKEVLEGENEN